MKILRKFFFFKAAAETFSSVIVEIQQKVDVTGKI